MTLGSLAMAAEQALTLAPYATVSPVTSIDGGNSDGLVFTLKSGSERTQILNNAVMPATGTTVTLTSIEIANKSGQDGLKNYAAVITDDSGKLLGWCLESTTKNVTHKDDWGLDYTRNYTTYSDFSVFDEVTPVTLTVGKEYHVYFAASSQQYDVWESYLAGDGVIATELYTKASFLTVNGKFDGSTAREYGFINGVGAAETNMKTWAPALGVTISYTPQVPEPTTGTLSLLALAGLCIRRRK